MSKKDYDVIADAIRPFAVHIPPPEGASFTAARTDAVERTARDIALRIADRLANDNTRFDRARFLRACGIDD